MGRVFGPRLGPPRREKCTEATRGRKDGKTYRYYVCLKIRRQGRDACVLGPVPAGDIDRAVVDQLRGILASPEIVARVFREAQKQEVEELDRLKEERAALEERVKTEPMDYGIGRDLAAKNAEVEESISELEEWPSTEDQIATALKKLDPIWEELFPGEKARVVRLLADRVVVSDRGVDLRIRPTGLTSLLSDLGLGREIDAEAV